MTVSVPFLSTVFILMHLACLHLGVAWESPPSPDTTTTHAPTSKHQRCTDPIHHLISLSKLRQLATEHALINPRIQFIVGALADSKCDDKLLNFLASGETSSPQLAPENGMSDMVSDGMKSAKQSLSGIEELVKQLPKE